MSMFKWDVVDPGPGEAVAPQQRLAWGKTVGLGAQHVVAMFGATFVFPIVMGLNANLAIMMSGIATICFLLIVEGHGAELPRHERLVRRCRRRHLRPGRRTGRRHRRHHGLGHRPRRWWVSASTSPAPASSTGAAARRHRRGGHADRLQPLPRRDRHLHARRPVGRPHHDVRRRADGGRAQGLPRSHRDLPRPHLRLRPLARLRPHRRRRRRGRPRRLDQLQGRRLDRLPAPHRRRPAGQPEPVRWRQQPRRGRLAPARTSRSRSPCWRCRPSSRWSRRTWATSRPSPA